MRTPYDQFAKQSLEGALSGSARIETDAEVAAPDVQRVDVYCVPDPARDAERRALGLIGGMIADPCVFELFHQAPNVDDILACLRKKFTLRHLETVRRRREIREPLVLWIIAAGRPDAAIADFEMRPIDRWPRGFYSAARGFDLRLVVVSELPKERETLFLRLMGASRVLFDAIRELSALPDDAWEKIAARPAVLRLRLTIPGDPALRSPEDEELAMTTSDIYETWKQRVHDEGVQEGLQKGLVTFYQARFGTMPPQLRAALEAVSDPAVLERWSSIIATQSKDEIENALLGPQ